MKLIFQILGVTRGELRENSRYSSTKTCSIQWQAYEICKKLYGHCSVLVLSKYTGIFTMQQAWPEHKIIIHLQPNAEATNNSPRVRVISQSTVPRMTQMYEMIWHQTASYTATLKRTSYGDHPSTIELLQRREPPLNVRQDYCRTRWIMEYHVLGGEDGRALPQGHH
jgi:hypothetical protein